jgi:type II secretory pathway component PulF
MNYSKVFSKAYILDSTPPPESNFYPILLAIFGAMIIFGILVLLVSKKEKTFLAKFITPTLTCGILGLIHVFGRYESLPVLATRYYLLSVIVIFIILVAVIGIKVLRKLPTHKKMEKTELRYNKYLPKKKHKSL